jgi:Kae1-associated kinase Bud32
MKFVRLSFFFDKLRCLIKLLVIILIMKFHKKGAEAELFQTEFEGKKALLKKRVPKNYRDFKLDLQIRKKRTRSEAKLIQTVQTIINVPSIYFVDEKKSEIIMEFIEGKKLKEIIEKKPLLAKKAGEEIKKIHSLGIIHGDLTTSNIIYSKCSKSFGKIKDKLVFVDFGLGYFSKKTEEKATDLIVFKKTFNATHSSLKNGWKFVMQGYSPDKEIIEKMQAIEKRARYH